MNSTSSRFLKEPEKPDEWAKGYPNAEIPGFFIEPPSYLYCNLAKMEHQPNNPLHGVTLEFIVVQLVERYGWEGLGERIPINCFLSNPSVKSSLTFLRKTPWARKKVEDLFIELRA
jgi:DNA-binding protein VF530